MLVNLLSIAVVAVAASCIPSSSAAIHSCKQATIKHLAVFGDSVSDNGNVYKLTDKQWPPAKYYKGRFSNGPVWAERVAEKRGYKLKDRAFGGATTDSKLVQGYTGKASDVPVPGFTQQLDKYIKYVAKVNPKDVPETLFVVNFQGNDYFFNNTLPPSEVVGKIRSGIERLAKLGAKHILLVENQNMGLIPYFSNKPEAATAFTAIATKERALLEELVDQLHTKYGTPPAHPFRIICQTRKVNIGVFDLWELFANLYKPSQLKKLGITDVVHGCVSSDYSTICKKPGKYFFWDDFHPSQKVHEKIADGILELL